MVEIKKLNTKRLLAYYRSEYIKAQTKYSYGVVDEDNFGNPIMGYSNPDNDPDFDKNIDLLNDLKNELKEREHID